MSEREYSDSAGWLIAGLVLQIPAMILRAWAVHTMWGMAGNTEWLDPSLVQVLGLTTVLGFLKAKIDGSPSPPSQKIFETVIQSMAFSGLSVALLWVALRFVT